MAAHGGPPGWNRALGVLLASSVVLQGFPGRAALAPVARAARPRVRSAPATPSAPGGPVRLNPGLPSRIARFPMTPALALREAAAARITLPAPTSASESVPVGATAAGAQRFASLGEPAHGERARAAARGAGRGMPPGPRGPARGETRLARAGRLWRERGANAWPFELRAPVTLEVESPAPASRGVPGSSGRGASEAGPRRAGRLEPEARAAGASAAGRGERSDAPPSSGPGDGVDERPRALPREAELVRRDAASAKGRRAAWAGLPRALLVLLGTFLLTQVGIEALGLGAPQLAGELAEGFDAMTGLAVGSMGALTLSSLAGGPLIGRWGSRRVYFATLAGRAVVIAGMTVLLAFGALSAWGLVAFFLLDDLLLGVSRTAEDALPAEILRGDVVQLGRFGMIRGVIEDVVGTAGPLAAGLAILHWGFVPLFALYPALFALSAVLALSRLRKDDAAARSNPAAAQAQPARLGDALRALREKRFLGGALLAYAVFYTFNIALYFLLGPAFGLFASGGDAQAAAQITSGLTAANAAGGVAGAFALSRVVERVRVETAGFPEGRERAAAELAAMRRRMAAWTAFGALAMPALWAMSWSQPAFTLLGLPLYPAQLLMLPLGFTQTVTVRGLLALIQAAAPDSGQEHLIGVARFASFGLAMGAFLLMGWILGAFSTGVVPGSTAMFGLNLVAAAGAALAAAAIPALLPAKE